MSPALEFDDPVLDIFSDKSLAVEAILVLSAELQSEVLAATIKHTEHLQLGGSVISGFSDALALGPILDMLILERMWVIGVSNHSEAMLRAATPNLIINRAKHLARKRWEELMLVFSRLNGQEVLEHDLVRYLTRVKRVCTCKR